MLTSLLSKKWGSVVQYCGTNALLPSINFTSVDARLGSQSHKRWKVQQSSPKIEEEEEDDIIQDRELEEASARIDDLIDSNEEDILICEEAPLSNHTKWNDEDFLVFQFERLNTRLDSFDDRLAQIEWNQ